MDKLGQEKNNFYCLVLKNTVTQKKSILYVLTLFDKEDLEYNQSFVKATMHYLNIEQIMSEKQSRKWWSKVKKLAKHTLDRKRSNITCSLKKIFFGTYQD